MTARLWKRQVRLEIGDLVFEKLRIDFRVDREPDETPPSGRVRLFNLNTETEEAIAEKGLSIRLDAGYPETVATIFDGKIDKVERGRRGSSRVTSIDMVSQAADRLGGLSVRSYDGPESIRSLARDLIDDMGLEPGSLDLIPADAKYENWTWSLSASAGLTLLLQRVDLYWIEDDGVVRLAKAGIVDGAASDIVLNAQNGLVGVPALTERGAECISLLNPQARVGAFVTVESRSVQGDWKLAALRHQGSNWSGPFTTSYLLRPLETNA